MVINVQTLLQSNLPPGPTGPTGPAGSSSSISNGTSNINIATSGGNITAGVGGTANVLVLSSTGANITGTLNVSGNANVGNIGGAGAIFTTLGGSLTTAAQPNVTSVGTLTSLTITGNATAGNVYANTGTIGGSLLTGTLTTASQPNITSVGTLGSLAVTANVTAGNVYANSGTGGFTTLTASGNVTGANVIANTYNITGVTVSISAAGTVQSNATGLTTAFNVVSTVASGAGVRLPTAVSGMRITIVNTSANSLNVYPATNGIINSQAANAAYSLPTIGRLDFVATSTTQWYTMGSVYV